MPPYAPLDVDGWPHESIWLANKMIKNGATRAQAMEEYGIEEGDVLTCTYSELPELIERYSKPPSKAECQFGRNAYKGGKDNGSYISPDSGKYWT